MKLYSVIFTAIYLCILSMTLRNAVFYVRTYESKVQEYFLSYSAQKFISQSFKNTCSGRGFSNLEEWKNVCNALFTLEEISYEAVSGQNKLMHAKWSGCKKYEKCRGEVYYKVEEWGSYEN